MRVAEWFEEFYKTHVRRTGRNDFPQFSLTDPYVESWRHAFVLHGVKQEDAEEASKLVAANPPPTLALQLQSVIEEVKTIQRARLESETQEISASRAHAADASWDCPECDGDGFAIRDYVIPDRYGSRRFRGSLFCRCAMGRYIESVYRNEHPDDWAKRDDLQAHPDLWNFEWDHRTWSNNPLPPRTAPPGSIPNRTWVGTGEVA